MSDGFKDFVSDAAAKSAAAQKAYLNEPSAIGVSLTSLIQGGINLATKRKDNREFNKAITREQQGLYNKVGSYDQISNAYDVKSEKFFYDLISDYNVIKSHIDNGTMQDAELGKRDLATIKNTVDNYSDAIPKLLATAEAIRKAASIEAKQGQGAAGTLSVAGAPVPQLAIIEKIASGNADNIEFQRDGSNIILVDTSDPNNPVTLNINEFNKAITDKNNPYLKFVPDINDQLTNGYDLLMKNNKGEFQNTFSTILQPDPNASDEEKAKYAADPTAIRYMSKDNEEALFDALMGQPLILNGKETDMLNGGAYRELINQYGESIWEDMMPLTGNTPQWPTMIPAIGDKDYRSFYDEYYEPMLRYLAGRTIDENTKDLRRETKETDDQKQQDFTSGFTYTDDDKKAIASAKPGDIITLSDGRQIRKK